MHGSVTFGDQVLMGGDVAPNRYEEPKGFSLSVHLDNPAEAERIFAELSRDGQSVMPLEKTFWAERFGMLGSVSAVRTREPKRLPRGMWRPCCPC